MDWVIAVISLIMGAFLVAMGLLQGRREGEHSVEFELYQAYLNGGEEGLIQEARSKASRYYRSAGAPYGIPRPVTPGDTEWVRNGGEWRR